MSERFRCSVIDVRDNEVLLQRSLRVIGGRSVFRVSGNSFLGKPVSSKPKDLNVKPFVSGLLSIMSAMRFIQFELGPICFTKYQMTAISP